MNKHNESVFIIKKQKDFFSNRWKYSLVCTTSGLQSAAKIKYDSSYNSFDLSDTTSLWEKQFTVSFSPTEMICGNEIFYSDYKFSKHFSAGIGVGHIFPTLHNLITDEPQGLAYNGTIVRINSRYYFKRGEYIGLLGTYKDLYMNSASFVSYLVCGEDNGHYDYLQTERASLFGITYFIGHEKHYSKYFHSDFFIGVGLSFRNRDYTVYPQATSTCRHDTPNLTPLHYSEKNRLPAFPIGFKLVYVLHKKE
ncbi:MAG: hypothetical protein HY063_08120 [Bacteroidetes bacterium]|nr:hypothetical protein [Bacteroidota bacterium]